MKTSRRHLGIMLVTGVLSLLIGIGLPLYPSYPGQAQEEQPPLVTLNEEVIKRATVFVMQTYFEREQPVISCVGSGTLMSADGLILTNAHTSLPSETCRSDTIVIAVTVRLDEPPIPTYTAEVLDSSQGLDLAVLRINGYLDGRVIEPGSLQLPFVELGDSLVTSLDETISIVGYPDFGDSPVEITRGTISGFTAEARAGDRAWIRTSATVSGSMTGGGAYNREGKLVGIPTIAPARVGGENVDCRTIQDTNQDGRVDSNDHCVPVGGFISALRPSRLARGLVRAATLGIYQGESRTEPVAAMSEAPPTFDRLFFSTRVNEAGRPTNVVGVAPSAITSLYLFFDYNNMVDGMVYELRVTVDDIADPIYSLPPVTWSGGERGVWYIGSAGLPWRNGLYDFRLFIEGREVASRRITIGGGPREDPSFADIVFGLPPAEGANLVGTSYVLPEGSAIQARFNYLNMQPGTTWSYIWYFEGQELARDTSNWDRDTYGKQGTRTISASAETFFPGQYRLELYIDNALNATADFVVAGGAKGTTTDIFPPFTTVNSEADPAADAPTGPTFIFASDEINGEPAGQIRGDFPADTERLYAFFNWRLIAPGTMWTRRWLVDDDPIFEVTEPWNADPDGENYFVSLTSLNTLPDGTYTLEISIANVTLASASAKIGLGQLPVGTFASAEGVQMTGRITDAETGEGIPGALFIVLKAEYSVEDFLWDQSQVLGVSLADNGGRFQIPVLLPRGTEDDPLLYSVLVRAEGYLPISADGITIIETTESPVELNIELSRQ
jgi:hypothetical protein